MTLERDIFCPSHDIKNGASPAEVGIDLSARAKRRELLCIDCYEEEGESVALTYVGATTKRVHFRHPGGSKCARNYQASAESDRHRNSKVMIADLLRSKLVDRDVEVIVDRIRFKKQGVSDRQPDVIVVYPNTAREAHEIQYSDIPLREIVERTEDMIAHGFFKIVWYLGEKMWADTTVREWLWLQQKATGKVFHYRLEYSEDPLQVLHYEDDYYNLDAETEREWIAEQERQKWALAEFKKGQTVHYMQGYGKGGGYKKVSEAERVEREISTVENIKGANYLLSPGFWKHEKEIFVTRDECEEAIAQWNEERRLEQEMQAEKEEYQRWLGVPLKKGQVVWNISARTKEIVEQTIKDFEVKDGKFRFLLSEEGMFLLEIEKFCLSKQDAEQKLKRQQEEDRLSRQDQKEKAEKWQTERKAKEEKDRAIAALAEAKYNRAQQIRSELAKIKGGVRSPRDQRPYVDALCANFPGLYAVLEGGWEQAEQAAALNLGKTAIAHGSAPMAQVFLKLIESLKRDEWLVQSFGEKERSRLQFLFRLATQ